VNLEASGPCVTLLFFLSAPAEVVCVWLGRPPESREGKIQRLVSKEEFIVSE